ncbi:MAG: hypothetical protein MUF81_17645, partial [Verrucomicrobia bacterium]|nr:hypothetical protein [Verrucomicrobiota bacterium]
RKVRRFWLRFPGRAQLRRVRRSYDPLFTEHYTSGEIFYEDAGGPRLVRGTPPLLETGLLVEEKPEAGHAG